MICTGKAPRGTYRQNRRCGMVAVEGWTLCAVHLKIAKATLGKATLEQFKIKSKG